jgi:hypothetical protein
MFNHGPMCFCYNPFASFGRKEIPMADLPTFRDFSTLVTRHVKEAGKTAAIDDSDLVVLDKNGSVSTVSLDKLYRAFVDLSIQNPSVSQDSMLKTVLAASDNFRNLTKNKPIFNIKERPVEISGTVMMQKCVSGSGGSGS